jgi:hypothetical protein
MCKLNIELLFQSVQVTSFLFAFRNVVRMRRRAIINGITPALIMFSKQGISSLLLLKMCCLLKGEIQFFKMVCSSYIKIYRMQQWGQHLTNFKQ